MRETKTFRAFSLVLIFTLIFGFVPPVYAASLSSISDTMSRLSDATLSDHTIRFTTPTGVDASTDTITIAFPAGFTLGSVDFSDIDLSHGASTGSETEETLAATAASAVWGALFTGTTLTLTPPTNATTGEITAGNKVIVEIGNNATGGNAQLTNPSIGVQVVTIAGNFGDSGKFAVSIIDNDQVVVSATVDPSITFSISANTSAFGVLSPGSVITAATDIVATIGTNSANGYTVYVKDQGSGTNPGLYNSGASYLIGSVDSAYANGPFTLVAGTEGYGIYVNSSTGTPTISTRYATAGQVGGLEITDTTLFSRATSMTSNDTATVRHQATIGAWTRAGTYSDVITYTATSNF